MARLNRLVLAGFAHHVTQRAVSGTNAFGDDDDRARFLQMLMRCSREQQVAIHAYALLDDEVQLIATPVSDVGIGGLMQSLARLYVPAFNRRHARAGALWQGRFRAAPVGGAEALLNCMLYLEQAPVRAGMATSAAAFRMSSAAAHAGTSADRVLAPIPVDSGYWQLGNTPFERDAAYARLLDMPLSPAHRAGVEATTSKGWAYGPAAFSRQVADLSSRRATTLPRGRPKQT